MSLYIAGSLISSGENVEGLKSWLNEVARIAGVTMRYDCSEEEEDFFANILSSSANAVLFMLTDDLHTSDSTSNWISSTATARKIISPYTDDVSSIKLEDIKNLFFPEPYFDDLCRTGLGYILSRIIRHTDVSRGAIWIADGGPEGYVYLSDQECEKEILKTMVLTWDCLPNLAYVWQRLEKEGLKRCQEPI